MYTFLGVLLLSGCHQLPNRRLYWSKSEDCSVEIVSNSITRNRFEEILKYLHLADNARYDWQDRLYKVRPLFSVLNKNFKIPFQIENISVDESIIPNLFCGKPIRFGFKLWCLSDSAGYLYHAEPYAGVDTDLPKTDLGQGGDVVLGLVDKCRVPPGMKVFFDNFFTSENLLKELTRKGIGATGTFRENRVKEIYNLPEKIQFKRLKRGKAVYRSDGSLLIMRWNDSNV
ncbi:hypothetical protein J437_LFUL001892, partial [Ladona fulva]